MNTLNEKAREDIFGGEGYDIMYDNEQERNVMVLKIPLRVVSENKDWTSSSMMLRGFFDMMKDEALAIVKIHKLNKAKSSLIVPTSEQSANSLKVIN